MKYFSLLLFLILVVGLDAQTDDLPTSEIEILKKFNARLAETEMIAIHLPNSKIDTNRSFVRDYKLNPPVIDIAYTEPTIKPLAMEVERNPSALPFYLRIGYGLRNNPFLNASYYLSKDEYTVLGEIRYETFKDLDLDQMKFSDFELKLQSTIHLTDVVNLEAGLSYLKENRGLYAAPVMDGSKPKYAYSIPQIQLAVKNADETQAGINYNINYLFRNTEDNFTNKENYNRISAETNKNFMEGDASVGIRGYGEWNQLKNPSNLTLNNYVLGVNGSYHVQKWRTTMGLDFGFLKDETKVLPQLFIQHYHSLKFQPFVGISSMINQNNFYSLSRQNLYLTRQLDTLVNQITTELFVGSKGNIHNIKYEIKLNYNFNTRQALFVNVGNDTLSFHPVYDDLDLFSIAIKGTTEIGSGFSSSAHFILNSFNENDVKEAWHLPTWSGGLSTSYNRLLSGRLNMTAELNLSGGAKYLNLEQQSSSLGTYVEFSISSEYTITDQLDVFLNLANLFDSRKPQFARYHRIGIHPQLGIKLRF